MSPLLAVLRLFHLHPFARTFFRRNLPFPSLRPLVLSPSILTAFTQHHPVSDTNYLTEPRPFDVLRRSVTSAELLSYVVNRPHNRYMTQTFRNGDILRTFDNQWITER